MQRDSEKSQLTRVCLVGHMYSKLDHIARTPSSECSTFIAEEPNVNQVVVLKVTGSSAQNEYSIMKRLSHPNIVRVIAAGDESWVGRYWIAMEFCHHLSLREYQKTSPYGVFPKEVAQDYVWQIAHALDYLHNEKLIIHGDVKPGNILVSAGNVAKLCDFDMATVLKSKSDLVKKLAGTPNYVAPEILRDKCYGFEVDIWSLGVCFVTLVLGRPPFERRTCKQTHDAIERNDYNIWKTAWEMDIMLFDNPSLRPTARDLVWLLRPT